MDISTLQSALPYLSYVTPVALAAALLWVVWRGKSMYPFWLRLWALFYRKEPENTAWLSTAMEARHALLKFRILFGWVDTLTQALRLDAWAKRHGTDVGTVCDCGEFFDRKNPGLKTLPSRTGALVRIVPACFAVGFLVVFGAAAVVSGDAVFALKSTGRWLAVDGNTVRAFGGDHWTALNKTDCAGKDDPGHLGVDRASACELLESNRIGARVHDVVGAQRAIGCVAWLYAFLIGVPAWRYGASLRIALALQRELERDDGDDDAGDGGAAEPRLALVG